MVYELAHVCGWRPDLHSAEAIYVGLVTDTGFFRFNSTNPQAHVVAAELIEIGVNPAKIYQSIYERNSEAYTRLLGHALAGLRLDAGGAVASVVLAQQVIDEVSANEEDPSEITTALLAMEGVSIALMFRELPEGKVKVSLRSKGDLDVHKLASEFGGGGHHNASGIVMEAALDQAVGLVIERAAALVAQPRGG
jgi:phosphoesterase RecJ-like protein